MPCYNAMYDENNLKKNSNKKTTIKNSIPVGMIKNKNKLADLQVILHMSIALLDSVILIVIIIVVLHVSSRNCEELLHVNCCVGGSYREEL